MFTITIERRKYPVLAFFKKTPSRAYLLVNRGEGSNFRYVTWAINPDEPDNPYWGHYYLSQTGAIADFRNRAFDGAPGEGRKIESQD